MNKKINTHYSLFLIASALLLTMFSSCEKNKMDWGLDPKYGKVTVAELPLALREAISRYDVLKSYTDYTLGVGIDLALYSSNETYRTLVNDNFDGITAGYEMKHAAMVNASGQINFAPVDAVLDQLEQAGLGIFGHTLVWHQNQNASYLNSLIAPTIVPSTGGSVLDVSPLAAGTFSGWNRNNTGGMSVVGNGGLNNGPALRLEVASAGNEWDTQLTSPDIPATEGHRYEVSFWIKSDGAGQGRVSYAGMSNNYPWTDGAALFGTNGSWKKITYNTSTIGSDFAATANTIKVAFDLGKVPGVYYIDINSISIIDEDAEAMEYNYVGNGGFESGNIGTWSLNNPGTGIEVTTEEKYVGNYSVKMSSSATSSNAWDLQLASQDIPLVAGNDYTLSFYVKSNVAGKGRVSFPGLTNEYPWMNWLGAGASEAFTTSTVWSFISVDLNALEYKSGATNVKLSFDLGYLPDITYYIDDIKLVKKGGGGGAPGGIIIIEKTPDEKKQLIGAAMKDWITNMVTHYKDKVHAWDVVNEPMSESGILRTGANVAEPASDEFYWQDYIGQDYAVSAFKLARQYGNSTDVLFINDYNLETGAKLDGLINYVNYIESQGATVDGIGTQMHLTLTSDKNNIVSMFEKLAATGKKIKISELDIRVGTTAPTLEQYAEQAELYRYVAEMYNTHIPQAQQYGITVWGISDHEREHEFWLPDDAPNLWDSNYERKHAYKGFADGLAGKDVSEDFSGELEY